MGRRTTYDPGTFCWADLGTTNAANAKRFYTSLFEWEAEDLPDADGAGTAYTMFRVDGDRVAGLPETAQECRPAWDSFVSVADIQEVTSRVEGLGGELKLAPSEDAGESEVLRGALRLGLRSDRDRPRRAGADGDHQRGGVEERLNQQAGGGDGRGPAELDALLRRRVLP
jgi:predicted enzyme related to lactoylglutathione lyase